jgi:superfamily II DNA or RNA helicase
MLRDYQVRAISEIEYHFARGVKKVMLQMPTGSGKTRLFCSLIEKQSTPCAVVVRGRHLVDQASERLSIPHGVLMAGHPKFDPSQKCQVISIDTFRTRGSEHDFKLIVIDEAHTVKAQSFQNFLAQFPDANILGVSATPYGDLGFEKKVKPISIQELVRLGFLVPPRVFIPTRLDLSQIKKTGGDYNLEDSFNAFEKAKIRGALGPTWLAKCGPGSKSLVFAINVKHAEMLWEEYDKAGANTAIVTADTPLDLRKALIDQMQEGILEILINVATLHIGVDIPCLENVIIARPTKSRIFWVQAIGRGSRPYPGKTHFKVIDHTGSALNFPPFTYDDEIVKKKSKSEFSTKECPACGCQNMLYFASCIECGHLFFERKKPAAILVDDSQSMVETDTLDFESYAYMVADECKRKKYKPGFLWIRLVEKFGEDETRKKYRIYRKLKEQIQSASDNSK